MDDDFNTADAISDIFDLVRFVNTNAKPDASKAYLEALRKELLTLTDVLGFIAERKQDVAGDEAAWIEEKIAERAAAKKAKDYAKADAIRKELSDKGITLMDTKEGTKWKKD